MCRNLRAFTASWSLARGLLSVASIMQNLRFVIVIMWLLWLLFQYLAGFGKGGTSLAFWENVYGFDMKCVGEEVVRDATQAPIIDVIDSKDVITTSSLIQVSSNSFNLNMCSYYVRECMSLFMN